VAAQSDPAAAGGPPGREPAWRGPAWQLSRAGLRPVEEPSVRVRVRLAPAIVTAGIHTW